MPDIKQKAHKMFDERFRCIQGDCDGNGNIPVLVSGSRQISDTEFEQTQEWEAEQCQFHAQYIFPIKSFIDEIIDIAVAERDKDEIIKAVITEYKSLREELEIGRKPSETIRVYDQYGNGYLGGRTNSEYNQAIDDLIANLDKKIINAESKLK